MGEMKSKQRLKTPTKIPSGLKRHHLVRILND